MATEVLGHPGVVSADVDEGRNRLHFGVAEPNDRTAIIQVLTRLGIPSEAVVVELTPPIVPFIRLNQRVRPLLGGLRMARTPIGTPCVLGFSVALTEKGNVRDHRRSVVTNSHCTETPGVTEMTQFGQPSLGEPMAAEIDDPEYFTSSSPAGILCPPGRRCRFSDSARALYFSDQPYALAGIARPITINEDGVASIVEQTINGTFRIAGKRGHPLKGATVHKVGNVTGWTVGKVNRTCTVLNLAFNGQAYTFFCQGMVTGLAANGDSGSPEIDDRETNNIEIGRCIG